MFNKRWLNSLDRMLVFFVLILSGIGIMTIYSATNQVWLNSPSSGFFLKQIVWIIIGVLTMFLVSTVDYQIFLELSYKIYISVVIILLAVLFLGSAKQGSQRWFSLGPFSVQPSEFTKLAIAILLVRYFVDKKGQVGIGEGLMVTGILVGIPMLLIIKQPDLGTALLFLPLVFVILFVSGTRLKYILYTIGSGLAASPLVWFLLKDYQKQRLTAFVNPYQDPLGSGYHIIQSKIAIGSGGFFGKGWMAGTQSHLDFIPLPHNDFIFAVLCEEWGFFGALVLITLYLLFFFQGIRIAMKARDAAGSLLAIGLTTLLAFQVIINIGMSAGIMPVVGISLPFVSYGGSSFLVNMIIVGILLNINLCSRKVFS